MINHIRVLAKRIRKDILEVGYASHSSAHYGGCLSLVEIMATLYGSILHTGFTPHRDRLILSKGHGALALYSTLYEFGIISKEELYSFEQNGSSFCAHAKKDIMKGIEFSGGSLSLGLSYGVGVAFACKKKAYRNHIYVVVGDGELNEGLIWESLMFASHNRLNNLTVIIDRNHLQIDGFTETVMNMNPLEKKLDAFGFCATEVDGHDIDSLLYAIKNKDHSRPNAIIANTVKGKGVSFMENNAQWHYKTLTQNRYNKVLAELDDNDRI